MFQNYRSLLKINQKFLKSKRRIKDRIPIWAKNDIYFVSLSLTDYFTPGRGTFTHHISCSILLSFSTMIKIYIVVEIKICEFLSSFV